MKKMFIILFVFLSVFLNTDTVHAFASVSGDVVSSWGTPPIIRGGWDLTWTSDAYIHNKKNPANAGDEMVAIVYMARQLVPKGGYFCSTQLRSRNNGSRKTKDVWTQYQEVSGPNNCMWLCEEGFSGDGCAPANTESACATEKITRSRLQIAGYRESGGWDDYSIENSLSGKAFFQNSIRSGKNDESDVIVVARSWLSNGNGIKAKPITFATFCRGGCGSGNSDLALIDGGGTEKTLCMPGWYGAGCTAGSVCIKCDPAAGTVWDNSPDKQKCVCSPKALDLGGGKCLVCPDGQSISKTKKACMTCPKTQKWNDATDSCVTRTSFSMTQMSDTICVKVFDKLEYRKCLDKLGG